MTASLLMLITLASGPMPLEDGYRWVYRHDGREAYLLEVDGTFEVNGISATVLRSFGSGALWWTSGAHLVTVGSAGELIRHGYVYDDDDVHGNDEPPAVLLPKKLEKGHSWRSGGFAAVVQGNEKVTVPAGTFDAWKIRYGLGHHLGAEPDLDVWFTPNVGIVKFERFLPSSGGVEKAHDKRYVWELVRAFQPATQDFGGFPKLSEEDRVLATGLIERLARKHVTSAAALSERLVAVGRGMLPMAAARAADPDIPEEARARLQAVIDRFPKLGVTLTSKATIKVGESPQFTARVRNLSPQPTYAIPSLDASDVGWRYPMWRMEIQDAAGKPVEVDAGMRCGNWNALGKRDFVRLRPGESLNPFGARSFTHYAKSWRPSKPGIYKARVVLDMSAKDPKDWHGELALGPQTDAVRKLLEELPRGTWTSDWTTIVVR